MKCLQDLVPGCNKVIGRAGMLDEIINYVQSLQRQVEVTKPSSLVGHFVLADVAFKHLRNQVSIYLQFLSMKLAALSPTLEFNIDNLSGKEVRLHSLTIS